jgi:hypothetical protein
MGLLDFKKKENLIEPICPYCKKKLEEIPKRKKKCPFCGNFFYIRTKPSGQKVIVTERETKEIEKEWKVYHPKAKWINTLNIDDKIFNKYRKELKDKSGKEPSERDVFWYIFNDLIKKESNDLHSLKMLYFDMALFLDEEQKDFFEELKMSQKMELLKFQKDLEPLDLKGKVKIRAGECSECKKLDEKIYTLSDALNLMPLPCPSCQTISNYENRGFCHCHYELIII